MQNKMTHYQPTQNNNWEREMLDMFRQLLPPASHRQDRTHVELGTYLSIISRRKWVVIIPLLIIPLITLVLLITQEPSYQATATISIEPNNPKVVTFEEVIQPDQSSDYMQTQHRLIKSYDMVGRVVDAIYGDNIDADRVSSTPNNAMASLLNEAKNKFLQLAQYVTSKFGKTEYTSIYNEVDLIRYDRIKNLIESIIITSIPDTRLVNISISGNNPNKITTQVNTLADIFVNHNLLVNRQASSTANIWIKSKVDDLKEQIYKSELELMKFIKQENYTPRIQYESQSLGKVSTSNITEIESLINEIKTQKIDLETKLEKIERFQNLFLKDKFLSISSSSLEIPLLQSLVNQYIEVQGEIQLMSKQYKNQHPIVQILIKKQNDLYKSLSQLLGDEFENVIFEIVYLVKKELALNNLLEKEREEILKYDRDAMSYRTLRNDIENKRALYEKMVSRLNETEITKSLPSNNISISQRAIVPIEPINSHNKIKLLVSIILSLAAGMVGALLIEKLNRSFISPTEIENLVKVSFLGTVPHEKNYRVGDQHELVDIHEKSTDFSNAYRKLRASISFHSISNTVDSLLITSAGQGEGKTTTVVNLGLSFAQTGKSVLLIDTNLRQPSLHPALGLENRHGLSDVLLGTHSWWQVIQNTVLDNLKVVTSGSLVSNPTELLSMETMASVGEQLNHAFDLVILDSPSLLGMPDAALLASTGHHVLFVHDLALTNRKSVLAAKNMLSSAHARILGMIFNNITHQDFLEPYPLSQNVATSLLPRGKDKRLSTSQETSDIYNQSVISSVPNEYMKKKIDVTMTINEVRCIENKNSLDSKEGKYLLDIGISIMNNSEISFNFELKCATLLWSNLKKYVNSEFELYSESEFVFNNKNFFRLYYPLLNSSGCTFAEEETIAAHEVRQGRLLYHVHDPSHDYVFVYDRPEIQIRLPLMNDPAA